MSGNFKLRFSSVWGKSTGFIEADPSNLSYKCWNPGSLHCLFWSIFLVLHVVTSIIYIIFGLALYFEPKRLKNLKFLDVILVKSTTLFFALLAVSGWLQYQHEKRISVFIWSCQRPFCSNGFLSIWITNMLIHHLN